MQSMWIMSLMSGKSCFKELLGVSSQFNRRWFYAPDIKMSSGKVWWVHWRRHICIFMTRVCVCVCSPCCAFFSCSQKRTHAWWRFNPVPLFTYSWLVVVVISAEDFALLLVLVGTRALGSQGRGEGKRDFALVFCESLTVCRTNWLLRCTCAWHYCCERKVGM